MGEAFFGFSLWVHSKFLSIGHCCVLLAQALKCLPKLSLKQSLSWRLARDKMEHVRVEVGLDKRF